MAPPGRSETVAVPVSTPGSAPFNTISVIGLGYIGLPTAAVFAGRKIRVVGVDVNHHAVETINRGKIHIVEPDLDMVVRAAVTEGYLRATLQPEPADAFLIAVPTPLREGRDRQSHDPDLSHIEAACRSFAPVLKRGDLIVLESTSPVGTTEQLAGWLADARPDLTFPTTHGEASDIRIAHCPERVLPGQVLRELTQNDRLIGGMTARCSDRAVDLYKMVVRGECIVTDCRTAELAKLTENSFRDINIAFANELSIICDKLDIDVWELISLANRHPRVNILQPGPGVGGHCIAVDPWFIVSGAPEEARLIRAARETNDNKPAWVVSKVDAAMKEAAEKGEGRATIACFGLAFKANIDDLRESPAVEITEQLAARYPQQLLVVEPHIKALPASLNGRARKCSLAEALAAADILVMLVDHNEFRKVSGADLANKTCIDTRGIWTTRPFRRPGKSA